MTLKELIANCIRFVTQSEDEINASNLEIFKESGNYKAFLVNALPEINRAIQEITHFEKYDFETKEYDLGTENSTYKMLNDSIVLFMDRVSGSGSSIVYKIFRVELIDSDYNIQVLPFQMVDKNTIKAYLGNKSNNSIKVRIVYYPRYPLYNDVSVGNNNELPINNDICISVIPYIVKYQLWQDIEPELAQLCRQIGLQNLSLIKSPEEDYKQNEVVSTWTF